MSQFLDQLLGEQRRTECEKHDEAATPQFPTPEQVTDAWHRRNDAQARALQEQYMDAMRRAGAL